LAQVLQNRTCHDIDRSAEIFSKWNISRRSPTQNEYMKKFLFSLLFALGAFASSHAQSSAQANPIACALPTAAAPIWGKLVISGNLVTCYYAKGTTTPTTWTQMGSQTINFINNPLLVGIFLTAHDSTVVGTGTLDNFSITPAPKYRLTDVDIGAPSLMGSANLLGSVWHISGSGADIWNSFDQFNFQPWLVWGDCTVICRLTSLAGGNGWEKFGIMVRDGFNSGSDYAMFCATSANGVVFQYRTAFKNNADETQFVAPPAPGIVSSIETGYGLTGSASYILRP
jgi:hypothetical protein